MPAGLDIEKFAEFLDVDEISIDAHTKAKWSVHFDGQLNCHMENEVSFVGIP